MNPHGLPDGDMLLLLALEVGSSIHVIEDEMRLPNPAIPGAWMAIPPGALDRLEEAGLVAIGSIGVLLTERGRYWLGKWMTRHLGRGRFVPVKRG